MNNLVLLKEELQNNNKKVSSLFIADYFGKAHKTILRDIRNMNDIYEKLGLHKIVPSYYINSQNKKQPAFILNELQAYELITKYDDKLRIMFMRDWYRLKEDEVRKENEQRKLEKKELKKIVWDIIEEKDNLKIQNDFLIDKITTTNMMDISTMSFELNIGRNTFMQMLRNDGYLYKNHNKDYNRITMKGKKYLDMKVVTTKSGHVSRKVYVNSVGYKYFMNNY